MIANTLFITVVLLLALGFWLMGELKFCAPYKLVLWREYATPILTYVALLSLSLANCYFADDSSGFQLNVTMLHFDRLTGEV
jgi:hypothetical protein